MGYGAHLVECFIGQERDAIQHLSAWKPVYQSEGEEKALVA